MSNPNEDSFHAPNPNHNVNSTYVYVGDERTSGSFFWNVWEGPKYFSPDFLL